MNVPFFLIGIVFWLLLDSFALGIVFIALSFMLGD